jgi:hypothetical protein
MSVSAGDVLLFVFGLVPQYVSVIAVEKHFTNFWTGFWNIYGLIEVVVSLTITSDNPILILSGVLTIAILTLVLLISLQPGFASIARSFGASLATTSFSWGLFFWFSSNNVVVGGFAFGIHAVALFFVREGYRNARARAAPRRTSLRLRL